MIDNIWIFILAVVLDLALAEPPNAIHLTVWIGRTIAVFEKIGLAIRGIKLQFIFGMLVSVFLIGIIGFSSYLLLQYLSGIHTGLFIIAAVLLFKPTFCLRESWQLSLGIKKYLESDCTDIQKADRKIRFLLTTVEHGENGSTDTQPIISSTIRSLMENASDFLVAPLFYYLFLGVPGAIAYRVSNTLDGMLGHRGQYEYLGKFAAHFDDVLNFIPARLTGFTLVAAAWFSGLNAKNAWRIMLRDHGKTESPNAGWPMAAAAGALEVRLDRAGHYELGDAARPLTAATIGQGVRLFRFMAAINIIFSVGILFLLYFLT
ncbi:adenosylcobinamide-phosphate synthase CbiB [Dehalogenimonas sp. THU2]|uniref:adenosylcobinamide-phosphate synthase CbiB n=1 Tax=Dehalogenimonas sp. THU2 TaxID=3151121 RepID=UPI0032189CC2